jgi:tRNA(fMet)-specific endonuclease VapC
MLDTNTSLFIIKGLIPKERLAGKKILISSIVAAELYYGAYKKGSLRLMEVVEVFLRTFEVIPFDLAAAKKYGKLRAKLEKKGEVIGAYDLQIAAHALALGAVLVSDKEFRRIEGLKVQNWRK